MNMETFKVPQTPELVKGSHGAPAKDGEGLAIFMLSGNKANSIELPSKIDMIEIAPLIKEITKAF